VERIADGLESIHDPLQRQIGVLFELGETIA
jgi:hypothetical protein